LGQLEPSPRLNEDSSRTRPSRTGFARRLRRSSILDRLAGASLIPLTRSGRKIAPQGSNKSLARARTFNRKYLD
jgi:hypothetical protein